MENKYDVIVIGAGMCGLTAAKALAEQGYKVLILEGNKRAGGRIYTVQSKKHIPIPMGPLFLDPGTKKHPNPLVPVLRELNVKMIPIDINHSDTFNTSLPLHPHSLRTLRKKIEEEYDAANMKIQEAKTILKHYAFATVPTLAEVLMYTDNTIPKPGTTAFIARQTIGAMVEQNTGASLKKVTVKALMTNTKKQEIVDESVFVTDGYQTLIDSFVKQIHDSRHVTLKLNSPVTEIHTQLEGNRVKVITQNQEYSASCVLCTLPLNVLQQNQVKFIPPLPKEKQTALKHLKVGLQNRVVLEFTNAFWRKDAPFLLPGSNSVQRWPRFFNLFYFSNYQSPMLICDYYAEQAENFKSHTDEEIVQEALKPLHNAYGNTVSPLKSSIVTHQETELFSGISFYDRDFKPHDLEILRASEAGGALRLAGSYLNPGATGTVASDYEAGLVAAKKMDRYLTEISPKPIPRKKPKR